MTDNYSPKDHSDDHVTTFSAVGPTVEAFVKPDLIAPGGHMLGIMDELTYLAGIHPEFSDGSRFYVMSGTSQASAVVAGTAALLLQAEPNLSQDDVKCRLMNSAKLAVANNGLLQYSPFQQGED